MPQIMMWLHLVSVYAQRMATGPPLIEPEFCLYQQLCAAIEGTLRDFIRNLEGLETEEDEKT